MENRSYIKQRLGAVKAQKLLAELDEDDILNPEDAIKRYYGGIDMDYMVELVGGDDMPAEEASESLLRTSVFSSSIRSKTSPLLKNAD